LPIDLAVIVTTVLLYQEACNGESFISKPVGELARTLLSLSDPLVPI